MNWDWGFAYAILPSLLRALAVTAELSAYASALALCLGLIFAVSQKAGSPWVARTVFSFSEFIRRTPLLVQLYFLFYVLPSLRISLSPMVAGVAGLGLHYATYASEAYRSGIESLPRGQWEAAAACNLSRRQTWTHIILPQAFPPALPALANLMIALFKVTPVVSALGLIEIMGRAREIANAQYRYLEPITVMGILFLLISLVASFAVAQLEGFLRRARLPER